ncbi:MAG TPA: DNA recombination protein RmuC [Sphingomicrobium sp.]|nr:DNA recombination protein RmuC [Sphingomicrobium sp.]
MDAGVVAFIFVASLSIGLLLGWLLGSRQSAGERRTSEMLKLQRDELVQERDALRSERDAAERAKSALEADARSFDTRMADLQKSRDELINQFREVGDKLLEKAHTDFLEKAGQRLTEADKSSQAKLQSLLQPVELTLKQYQTKLDAIEKDRNESYGELKQAVAQLTLGNDQVRREAQRLANVMVSSPKARGRWGEEQLRTILESAGLAENVDFVLQTRTTDQHGQQQQPDCVINLPGDRCIVVDVKCPLVAFEQAYDEQNEDRRAALLLQHASALRNYANDLGKKGYWQRFDRSPDFVIMFIPGEHFLAAAAERAPKLIEDAFHKGVIIASTINMLALAKIMAGMWRQEALAAQAKEIAALGKELHARIQTMGAHVVGLGRNLRLATDAYDDFIGSLDAKVLTQAKRFEELKVAEGNKRIVDPQRIDFTPKVSSKLSINEDEPPQIAAE